MKQTQKYKKFDDQEEQIKPENSGSDHQAIDIINQIDDQDSNNIEELKDSEDKSIPQNQNIASLDPQTSNFQDNIVNYQEEFRRQQQQDQIERFMAIHAIFSGFLQGRPDRNMVINGIPIQGTIIQNNDELVYQQQQNQNQVQGNQNSNNQTDNSQQNPNNSGNEPNQNQQNQNQQQQDEQANQDITKSKQIQIAKELENTTQNNFYLLFLEFIKMILLFILLIKILKNKDSDNPEVNQSMVCHLENWSTYIMLVQTISTILRLYYTNEITVKLKSGILIDRAHFNQQCQEFSDILCNITSNNVQFNDLILDKSKIEATFFKMYPYLNYWMHINNIMMLVVFGTYFIILISGDNSSKICYKGDLGLLYAIFWKQWFTFFLISLFFLLVIPFIILYIVFYSIRYCVKRNREIKEKQIREQKLKQFKKGDYKKLKNNTKSNECVICLEQYEENSQIMILECEGKHAFHEACVTQWFEKNNTCPIDRSSII